MTLSILVIEDDAEDAEHLSRTLRASGIGCDVNRVEAWAQVSEDMLAAADVVIVDFYLTAGDSGGSAIREIRGDGFEMPIFVISGSERVEDVAHCFRCGASDFMAKSTLNATTVRMMFERAGLVASAHERMVAR